MEDRRDSELLYNKMTLRTLKQSIPKVIWFIYSFNCKCDIALLNTTDTRTGLMVAKRFSLYKNKLKAVQCPKLALSIP